MIKREYIIFLCILMILPAFSKAGLQEHAMIIIHGVNKFQPTSIPEIQIVEYGILDDSVSEFITPEVVNDKAIYRLNRIDSSKTIIFRRSDNVALSQIPFFLISPGDSVNIFLSDKRYTFSGDGHEKFECLYRLKQLDDEWRLKNRTINDQIHNSLDLFGLKEDLINTYRNKIGGSISDWIVNEIRMWSQITNYYALRFKKDDLIDYQNALKLVRQQDLKIDTKVSSHFYPSYFLGKYMFDLREQKKQKFSFDEAFQYLVATFNGLKREQIITYLIKVKLRSSTISSDQLVILNNFDNSTLKSYVKLFIKGKVAGKDAPDFSLTGIDGNKYSLEKLSGKVVVMDFWFTGCGACKLIPPILGPLAEKFKDNDDVAFLSISIDKNIEQWKRSVSEGDYTFEYSIKLYTNGLGRNHPIIKDYNVGGCPTIIEISKFGKILPLSINPRSDNGKSLEQAIVNELKRQPLN